MCPHSTFSVNLSATPGRDYSSSDVRYWWVNQNQTFRAETRGSFMWSPKRNANGARNPFYDTMKQVSPGDVVFSFCDTRIKAIGIVTETAQTGPKPDFGMAGANWSQEGWYVPVEYAHLERQMRPKDHIAVIRPFLPERYSPLQQSGDGLQGVYLTEVQSTLAEALIALIGQSDWDAFAVLSADLVETTKHTDPQELGLARSLSGPTFTEQLIKARRGQGVFRSNVLLREDHCRVTKVNEPRHLVASHIKPWRSAGDQERLDGANGLLLSPHIDHLFDQGYITFTPSRRLLVVPEVRDNLLDAWGIDESVDVGEFSREQAAYLDHHRVSVFREGL